MLIILEKCSHNLIKIMEFNKGPDMSFKDDRDGEVKKKLNLGKKHSPLFNSKLFTKELEMKYTQLVKNF